MISSVVLQEGRLASGFFGRRGGVSRGIFASLNCKANAGDDPDDVAANRKAVATCFGADSLITLNQIHSAVCHTVFVPPDRELEGDALVTDRPGLLLGVLTADCAPVLFDARKADGSEVIGAAHAGWGGAVKGILESTLAALQALGAEAGTIRARIGPCIARASYEVSTDFTAPFLEEDARSADFFTPGADGRLFFDLPAYVAFRLRRAGVDHIEIDGADTYAEESDWFSFRRSTHRGEKDYGRQVSAICIRKDTL